MKATESRSLARHDALVSSDSAYQRRLRLLQSLWRCEQDLPAGEHRGEPLGSSLAMPFAQETLANYLTPTIQELVREEVEGPKGEGKLFATPRIYNNLLSSQPLCFNLFGELAVDLDLATAVCAQLWPGVVGAVTSIEFEWSPGRGDPKFLANDSAFDVAIFHTTPNGEKGFIGIEVKYHENMRAGAADHKGRYDEVADNSGVFVAPDSGALRRPPLQQIWLAHMLGLSMLEGGTWASGRFVVLYPSINGRCSAAVSKYESQLNSGSSFQGLHMEAAVDAIAQHTEAEWVAAFRGRYLDYARAERVLDEVEPAGP
ncbi:MAG: hypothetical protein GY708_16705 [Actinomycetia bacterium]|nr:hypothetical protein [Actinomycetes bacterium]